MKTYFGYLLLCVVVVAGSAAAQEVSGAEGQPAVKPTPTPIPRSAVVFSYRGQEVSVGLFRTMNEDDLRALSREPEENQREGLRMLVERALMRVLLADAARKAGALDAPAVARTLRQNKIDWLFRYYQTVYTHKNFKPTEEDFRAYYEENIDRFRERERFKFRHIFFKTIDEPPEKQKLALERAREALARLKAGEDFVKIANEYSDSEKKAAVVGPFYVDEENPQKRINPLIQRAVLSLKPGQFSEIFPTKYGYEILRLEEYMKPDPKPIAQVRFSIERALRNRFFQESKAQFREKYMEEALTDWNPGIVDDPSADPDAVICRVYGEPVTVSMYRALFRGLARQARERQLQEMGRDEFIKEHLVLKMIGYRKALDLGLDKRAPMLERLGSAELSILFSHEINRRWQDYLEANPVTEERLRDCYEENRDRLLAPRRAEVAEIYREIPPHDEEVLYEQYKARQTAKQALLDALERIQRGEDFAAVAKEVSQATTAVDGGYVGVLSSTDRWRGRSFVSEVFRLQEGGISSEPIEVEGGYAIVRVLSMPPREPLPFEEARPRVERMLLGRMQREFYQGLVKELINWDEVDINEEILNAMVVRGAIAAEDLYEDE